MRVVITKDYDFRPPELTNCLVAYKASHRELTVKADWGKALVAAGVATEVEVSNRDAESDTAAPRKRKAAPSE